MRHILLPTDFSDNAQNAIDHAIQLYGNGHTKFYLFHSYFTPHTSPHASKEAIDTARGEALNAFDKIIEDITKNHNLKSGFEKIFTYGSLVESMENIIRAEDIDLIVMGTQGASGLEEVLVGSSTAKVITSVNCPVIAVPEKSKYRDPRKIVFAVDEQQEPLGNVIGPMVDIAQRFDAEVLLLHVDSKSSGYDEAQVKSYLEGIKFSYHTITSKNTMEGLESFIQKHEADILAMVTQSVGFLDKLFRRSLTRRMSMHTKVPLLAMHANV